MEPVNLRSFKKQAQRNKGRLRRFLSRLEKQPLRKIKALTIEADARVWQQVDCLSCANCCKTMTPTFKPADIKRIAAHLGMGEKAFKEKWLYKDRVGDWLNTKQPCQFLNLSDNKCSIYEVRPADCSGFPHHHKKKPDDYIHVYKQNVDLCPATYRWVEIMEHMTAEKEAGSR